MRIIAACWRDQNNNTLECEHDVEAVTNTLACIQAERDIIVIIVVVVIIRLVRPPTITTVAACKEGRKGFAMPGRRK